jgi:Tfp pilus assembly protein PilN
MIRTNLSTRPFYNERAVSFWLLVFLVVVVAATAFNTTRVLKYSRSDTELGTSASQDEARARELRASAAKLRGSVDAKQIERASNEARQANDLIDRRTFSWTELFNVFENTLPDDVRITAVRPKIDRGKFGLVVTIVSRSVDDINTFMNNLSASGTFESVGSTIEERVTEQGQIQASVEAGYKPSTGHAAGTGSRASGGGRQ